LDHTFPNYKIKIKDVKQFFTKLSQDYIEILKDYEYYDVTIEVGKDPENIFQIF